MPTIIQTVGYPGVVEALPPASSSGAMYIEFYDDTLLDRTVRVVNCVHDVDNGGPYAFVGGEYENLTAGDVVLSPSMGNGDQLSFGVTPDGGPGFFTFELEIETDVGSGVYEPFADGAYGSNWSQYCTSGKYEWISGPVDPPEENCFWDHGSMVGVTQDCG